MQAPGTAHAQLRVLKPQRNSRPWITAVFVAFAEKGLLQRKAISRRPSPLAPALVRATRTLMTPHCSQTKADAKGKRRRGETKAWHAHGWAHPPRRRRRQGHQRESRVGGQGERKESASGSLIHGSASSSACKASKAAAARRVLVARAYRYIQRRQLFSERQESNQDCRQFMTDKTDDSSR